MKTFSKKMVLSMMLAILLVPAAISAKVYFLEAEDESTGALGLVLPCRINYPLETCPDGKTPQNFCPTDNRYFQTCGCDSTVYQYNSSNCTGNKTLGGNACDGKYASCTCDSTKYMYDSTNCGDGKVLGGNSCDGKYETCGCDSTYTKTCSYPMVGSGSACDGKYQSCKCPSGYLTCDNGGAAGATQCTEENGTVKYSSCKTITCTKTSTTCAAEIGGVPADWTIKNATSTDCECYTTKKYVIMQDMKPEFVTYEYSRNKLRRIKATRNFGNVKYGDLGGYLESEDNLSHDGNAWLGCDQYGCALAMSCARIYDNAQVYGGPYKGSDASKVYQDDDVYGNVTVVSGVQETATNCRMTEIYGNAKVYGGSRVNSGKVYGSAILHGFKRHPEDDRPADARSWPTGISIAGEVFDNAQLYAGSGLGGSGSVGVNNNPKIYGNAVMGCSAGGYDSAICGRITYLGEVYGNAKVLGHATVTDRAKVYGYAKIHESATIGGDAQVYGNAVVGGKGFYVQGNAKIFGSASVNPVSTNAVVYACGNVSLSGTVKITGNAPKSGNTVICKGTYTSGTPGFQATSCSYGYCLQ